MSITIYYVDLRTADSRMEKHVVEWEPRITAYQALEHALGTPLAKSIDTELIANSPMVIIAWTDRNTGEHSGVGGVSALDWDVVDGSVLVVNHWSESTTEKQMNDSNDWLLKEEPLL